MSWPEESGSDFVIGTAVFPKCLCRLSAVLPVGDATDINEA